MEQLERRPNGGGRGVGKRSKAAEKRQAQHKNRLGDAIESVGIGAAVSCFPRRARDLGLTCSVTEWSRPGAEEGGAGAGGFKKKRKERKKYGRQ